MLEWFLRFMGVELQNVGSDIDAIVATGAVAGGVLLVWFVVVLVLLVIQNITGSSRRRR